MTHLSKGDDRWCDHEWSSVDINVDVDSRPENADCDACLQAAFEFGIRAMRRRLFLKDGRLLDRYQAIETLLDKMSHPAIFVKVK